MVIVFTCPVGSKVKLLLINILKFKVLKKIKYMTTLIHILIQTLIWYKV